ncbi:unnamed protein product [Oncorhynchus mykiss]|uniref:Calponin-homology (CH) domain-containing protein n=1 Tax=Oncorhynchus mykiss TaxID=8022 RepID=A0A060XYD1_ONCMY|nr:unnamed protein product [Oncorhynchus mykiss]
MNSAEQTVTWLITLGVLESPKKNISDPEAFLQTSLKDGVVLCRLLERLSPGSTDKVRAKLPFVFPSSSRLCLRESDMTRFITSLFCANWSMKRLFCGSRERGLLSLKTVPNDAHMSVVLRV